MHLCLENSDETYFAAYPSSHLSDLGEAWPSLASTLFHYRLVSDIVLIQRYNDSNIFREYITVPTNLKDHDVLPNISELPNIMATMRHPRRRAISVGPQSEADAYETLAYREKRRRESQSGGNHASPITESENKANGVALLPRKNTTLDDYEGMMGRGSPGSSAVDVNSNEQLTPFPSFDFEAGKRDEQEVFSQIKKTRVRYDVEVVTKLVVYAGIPWIVIEVAPLLFDLIGLGVPGV